MRFSFFFHSCQLLSFLSINAQTCNPGDLCDDLGSDCDTQCTGLPFFWSCQQANTDTGQFTCCLSDIRDSNIPKCTSGFFPDYSKGVCYFIYFYLYEKHNKMKWNVECCGVNTSCDPVTNECCVNNELIPDPMNGRIECKENSGYINIIWNTN